MLDQKTGMNLTQTTSPKGNKQQNKLRNMINALHYQGKPLLVTFYHPEHDYYFLAKGRPGPAVQDEIEVTWIKDDLFPQSLSSFHLTKITLPQGQISCVFVPEDVFLSDAGIQFQLPQSADDDLVRSHRRLTCQSGLFVALIHNGLSFPGCLISYSPQGMLIELAPDQRWQPSWLSDTGQGTLMVTKENQTVYSGHVTMVKKTGTHCYLLHPEPDTYSLYSPKKNRARRLTVSPAPEACFDHPFADVQCALTVCDLGSLGFSIEEKTEHSVLIPGLIIPVLRICIAGNEVFRCMVRVVYRQEKENEPDYMRFGLSILHITAQEHLKLIRLIHQIEDPRSFVNSPVNPDDLFRFFFETGFIYPEKYSEIAAYREEYHRTYHVLYQMPVDISRHFIYQVPGQILGHLSMIQLYSKTWINQHHSALQNHRAGMKVVRATSDYINESYRLESSNIRYILAYFRPDNKFPRQFFGEFARRTNDKTKVSLDDFAYFKAAKSLNSSKPLSSDWVLEPALSGDIQQFRAFYNKTSSGLLPQALDLTLDRYSNHEMLSIYRSVGLYRSREVFALRHHGELCALVDYQASSRGLNLSEITNAITFYFLDWSDAESLSGAVKSVIAFFVEKFNKKHYPVMMYPASVASELGFVPDKTYTLWVLDIVSGSDDYMNWMYKYCR